MIQRDYRDEYDGDPDRGDQDDDEPYYGGGDGRPCPDPYCDGDLEEVDYRHGESEYTCTACGLSYTEEQLRDRAELEREGRLDGLDMGRDDDYGAAEIRFADPGGRSALRAASRGNPRNLPCPNCGRPDLLTPADVARSYVCDRCADHNEGLGPDGNGDY